jgi:hypothetical protein
MKARLFYFTSPQPGKYVINIQPEGWDGVMSIEVSQHHMGHAIADGAAFAARESRVLAASKVTQDRA